jgi:hypothetical protein
VPFGYTVHGIVRYERPHDVAHVLGNPDKARRQLALAIQMAIRLSGRVPAAEFYRELNRRCASDLDLEQVIQSSRQPNSGITF